MSLVALGVVIALILACLSLCIGYLLFLQCGRLLLRIDAIDERLRFIGPSATAAPEPATMTEELPEATKMRPGAQAPSFRLPLLRGGDLALEEYRGRRVLLVISDPECVPCRDLLPRLEEIHRDSPEPAILLVSRGDREANAAAAAELGLSYPIVLQRGWEIAREYGMVAAPVGYLIDAQGTLEKARAVGVDAILALVENSEQRTPKQEEVFSRT